MYKIIFKDKQMEKRQRQDKLTEQNRINSAFSLFIFKVKKLFITHLTDRARQPNFNK